MSPNCTTIMIGRGFRISTSIEVCNGGTFGTE
jgi:hypothetical protein